jgi:phenol 2-monooxygenase
LYPRTLELLDQVDVFEQMAEIAHISRGYVNYNGGKRVISGTYHSMFNQLQGTYFDYVINIRQKYSEQIFRKAFESYGGTFYEEYELVSIVQDDDAVDDYALTVRVKNNATGEENEIKW